MLAILKKEIRIYFTSLLGYVAMTIILILGVIIFYGMHIFSNYRSNDMSTFFTTMNSIFLTAFPFLTMQTLAKEKNTGTYELLMTSPLTPWQIVFGKFLGVMAFVTVADLILIILPLLLSFFVNVLWSSVLTSLIGLIFSASFFISIGIFCSSITSNQLVSAILTFTIYLLLAILFLFSNLENPFLSKLFAELSFSKHYSDMTQGLIQLKDLLYFVIGTFVMLFLSKTMVESKTWK